jgi:hypothetical protein
LIDAVLIQRHRPRLDTGADLGLARAGAAAADEQRGGEDGRSCSAEPPGHDLPPVQTGLLPRDAVQPFSVSSSKKTQ